MIITVVLLLVYVYFFLVILHDRLNQLVSKRTVVEEKQSKNAASRQYAQ